MKNAEVGGRCRYALLLQYPSTEASKRPTETMSRACNNFTTTLRALRGLFFAAPRYSVFFCHLSKQTANRQAIHYPEPL